MIDLHTLAWANTDQLGPEVADRWRRRRGETGSPIDANPAAHERAMGCVDGAVILGFRSERLGVRPDRRAHPGRIEAEDGCG